MCRAFKRTFVPLFPSRFLFRKGIFLVMCYLKSCDVQFVNSKSEIGNSSQDPGTAWLKPEALENAPLLHSPQPRGKRQTGVPTGSASRQSAAMDTKCQSGCGGIAHACPSGHPHVKGCFQAGSVLSSCIQGSTPAPLQVAQRPRGQPRR